MKSIIRLFACILYYGLARHFPPSFTPGGKIFKTARNLICRPLFKHCGKNVNIESGAFFHSGQQISIGNNSGIGINAHLSGEITIGNDVMMGKDVTIMTRNHNFSRCDIPMNHQGFQPEQPVIISDDIWISDRVIILPGVKVGKGAILAAAAVVTKDVSEYSIVGGNPARVIKLRK